MTIKITKQLATMEDLAIGTGTVVQERNGVPLTLNKINFTAIVSSVAEMQEKQAIVGTTIQTLGYYSEGDGGGNTYEIVAEGTGTEDKGSFINLNNGLQAKGIFKEQSLNVKQFGATGNGSSNDKPAIKAAVNAAPPEGAVILFPNGNYYSPVADTTDINSWVLVEKNNITFKSQNKHGAVLENINILARGSYGNIFKIGASLESGKKEVSTGAAHNFSANSFIQIISGVSPYSVDANEWQNGSVNPTFNTRPDALFIENHKISFIESSTLFTLYDEVVFSIHKPNTTGQTVIVPGIDGAYVREVFPVQNFNCEDLVFMQEEDNSFTGIVWQRTYGGGLNSCEFKTNTTNPGVHVRCEEAVSFTIKDCIAFRDTTGASGSSWNSFIIGGGSSDIKINDNSLYGGSQIVDITPLLSTSLLFGASRTHGPDALYASVYGISVHDNYFSGGNDAFTTHPGTYNLVLSDNLVETGSTGFRIRSRINKITGNIIKTRRNGISLSAFYYDTEISSNYIKQIPDPDGGYWSGISIAPMSSEVMNNNDVDKLFIAANTFDADHSGSPTKINGIHLRHVNNGSAPNASFSDFTNTIKTNLSDYIVKGNLFYRCGVSILRFINGVTVEGNHFKGDVNSDHWISGEFRDSLRHKVFSNYFEVASDVSDIFLSDSVTANYGYAAVHFVGTQYDLIAGITLDVPTNVFAAPGSDNILQPGARFTNGAEIRAVRAAGDATLYIGAEVLDGTSRATLRINDPSKSNTTDARVYNDGLIVQAGAIWASPDNTHQLGNAALRWTEVFAANGTINTSDEREKQQVRTLHSSESAVATELKTKIRAFKWNDSVTNKGDGARWNFGVMAQEVGEVFERNGLNPYEYSLFCYNEWETEYDEKGELLISKGSRYGIRYDQLLAFIISAM